MLRRHFHHFSKFQNSLTLILVNVCLWDGLLGIDVGVPVRDNDDVVGGVNTVTILGLKGKSHIYLTSRAPAKYGHFVHRRGFRSKVCNLEDFCSQEPQRFGRVRFAADEARGPDGLHHVLALPVLVQVKGDLRTVAPRHQPHLADRKDSWFLPHESCIHTFIGSVENTCVEFFDTANHQGVSVLTRHFHFSEKEEMPEIPDNCTLMADMSD